MMIQLPPQLEEEARKIPDVEKRVAAFVRDMLELEQWRSRRYDDETRALVERAFARAEELRASGVADAESAQMLRRALDGIAQTAS